MLNHVTTLLSTSLVETDLFVPLEKHVIVWRWFLKDSVAGMKRVTIELWRRCQNYLAKRSGAHGAVPQTFPRKINATILAGKDTCSHTQAQTRDYFLGKWCSRPFGMTGSMSNRLRTCLENLSIKPISQQLPDFSFVNYCVAGPDENYYKMATANIAISRGLQAGKHIHSFYEIASHQNETIIMFFFFLTLS